MMVNVPVILVNERCLGCPELDIETTTMEITDTEEKYYVNNHVCKHLYRCKEVLLNQSSRDKHSNK